MTVGGAAAAAEGQLCFVVGVRKSTVVPESPTVMPEPLSRSMGSQSSSPPPQ